MEWWLNLAGQVAHLSKDYSVIASAIILVIQWFLGNRIIERWLDD